MNDASKIPGNLLATKVDPPGPATWISHKWRMFIAELLTCLMNPHITVLYLDSDGAATLSKDAEIVMGPAGWTATFDLTGLGGSGSGGSLELTDGTTDLTNVTKITVSGATVGGTSAAATLTIAAGGVAKFTLATSGTIDAGDYYNTVGGTKVAKQYKMRCLTGPGSESIRGSTYNYAYAVNTPYDEYIRNTTGAATTTDYITPPALAGDEIIAVNIPGILSGVNWIEVTERKWASS